MWQLKRWCTGICTQLFFQSWSGGLQGHRPCKIIQFCGLCELEPVTCLHALQVPRSVPRNSYRREWITVERRRVNLLKPRHGRWFRTSHVMHPLVCLNEFNSWFTVSEQLVKIFFAICSFISRSRNQGKYSWYTLYVCQGESIYALAYIKCGSTGVGQTLRKIRRNNRAICSDRQCNSCMKSPPPAPPPNVIFASRRQA